MVFLVTSIVISTLTLMAGVALSIWRNEQRKKKTKKFLNSIYETRLRKQKPPR